MKKREGKRREVHTETGKESDEKKTERRRDVTPHQKKTFKLNLP